MVDMEITWQIKDDGACPICKPLDGATWTFDTETEPFPRLLVHPVMGLVWDCDVNQPRTHGNAPHNCRCNLNFNFDFTEMTLKLREQIKHYQLVYQGINEFWQGRGAVRVVREQGRFVTWTRR